jgi:hypothetical protein
MDLNQNIALSPQATSQEVSGETVILDLESECYLGLDAVGTRIWELMGAGDSMLSIYNALLEEYEVEGPQLQADLEALLTDASTCGLVTLQETAQ